LRTKRKILKKIDEWKDSPMMVSGVYRLFTYIPFEDIPEKYRSFFPEEAEENWDKDLDEFGEKNIKLDIGAEIRALLKILAKRNITNALGIVPLVLADVYIYGYGTNTFQGTLSKIIKNYTENVDLDRNLAEQLAAIETVELLKDIVAKTKIKLGYDIDNVVEKLLKKYEAEAKKAAIALAQSQARRMALASKNKDSDNYEELIEEALDKEKETQGGESSDA
jgi:hypothetical protein